MNKNKFVIRRMNNVHYSNLEKTDRIAKIVINCPFIRTCEAYELVFSSQSFQCF